MVDLFEAHRKRPLAEHVENFRQELASRNNTPDYVALVISRLSKLLDGCGFVRMSDLSASRVMDWLAKMRRNGPDSVPLDEGKVVFTLKEAACVLKMKRTAICTAVSHNRLRHLLGVTRASLHVFRGLSGPDRFVLYATACGTGFRAAALASLTPEAFSFDDETPTVVLAARKNKNRKPRVQPIPHDVAHLLREYLRDKPAGQVVWGGTWARDHRGAEMLRIDLDAAGITYSVEGPDGPLFADFHSLRHTYLTLLGRGGVDLRTAQELAGHSTPTLTARYTHRRLYDLAGAVEKLPPFLPNDLSGTEASEMRATGTDGPILNVAAHVVQHVGVAT